MPRRPPPVVDRLFTEGYEFDFFQAVRVLGLWEPRRVPVGYGGPHAREVVRFRSHLALDFPASAVFDVLSPGERLDLPLMTVTFLGLTGPSGVLPVHYTEVLLRLDRETRGDERYAFRDWLDLFNHRLISLFYRAWEKYRFFPAYERHARHGAPPPEQWGEDGQAGGAGWPAGTPDPVTGCVFSLVGLGTPALRNRLRVDHAIVARSRSEREPARGASGLLSGRRALARIDDLALLYYSGLLAQRPRTTLGLETILQDYFGVPVRALQFQGQWLRLDPENQSRLGGEGNNVMGVNLVAGERVWDVQSKLRLRLGPMDLARFTEFLPDKTVPRQAACGLAPFTFFLLTHLARLYLGPELDFDIQLVLRAEDVPACRLAEGDSPGSRLGWDSWLQSQPAARDADDAVFEAEELYLVAAQGAAGDANLTEAADGHREPAGAPGQAQPVL